MVVDDEIFKEVVDAIGVETALGIINMFQEQSNILVTAIRDEKTANSDRLEALHALKGMSRQLGLMDLGGACLNAYTTAHDNTDFPVLEPLLTAIVDQRGVAIEALMHRKKLMLA